MRLMKNERDFEDSIEPCISLIIIERILHFEQKSIKPRWF